MERQGRIGPTPQARYQAWTQGQLNLQKFMPKLNLAAICESISQGSALLGDTGAEELAPPGERDLWRQNQPQPNPKRRRIFAGALQMRQSLLQEVWLFHCKQIHQYQTRMTRLMRNTAR